MEFNVSYVTVLIAAVVQFILGFLWYTPLFGKAWAKEMGYDPDAEPDMSLMMKGMVVMFVGNFLMAYVLGHNMAAYDPGTWGSSMEAYPPMQMALSAAFFTYIGFFFPVDIGNVFWEKKSWKLFSINTGYHFASLVVVALVLTYVKF